MPQNKERNRKKKDLANQRGLRKTPLSSRLSSMPSSDTTLRPIFQRSEPVPLYIGYTESYRCEMIRRHLSIFSYTWSFQVIFHCDIIHLLKGLRKLFYCMLISHTPENKLEKSSFFFDSFFLFCIVFTHLGVGGTRINPSQPEDSIKSKNWGTKLFYLASALIPLNRNF